MWSKPRSRRTLPCSWSSRELHTKEFHCPIFETYEEEAVMPTVISSSIPAKRKSTTTMRALVFRGPNQIAIEQVPIPKAGPGEAVIRVTLTSICRTDLHVLTGECYGAPGLVIGHK